MTTASAGGAATTGTGRVGNVDVLRAVAALSVLAGHAYLLGGRLLPVKAERWYDVPLINTASAVWLFFGISGYVIARPFVTRLLEGRPLPALVPYALRRAFRIFPLYWIALTAVIVIAGAGATQTWQYPLHYALLHNLVPGREGALFSVAWTLTVEVLFYIAAPLLALALRRARPALSAEQLALLVLVSWAASSGFTAIGDLSGGGRTGLWLRGSFPAMWQMFCPGILIALAPYLEAGRWRRWLVHWPAARAAVPFTTGLLLVAALVLALAPLRYGVAVYQLVADASRPLFAVGFGVVIAAAVRAGPWFQRRGRFVLQLGLVSYGIYLLHAVVLDALITDRGRKLIPLHEDTLPAYLVHVALLAGLTIPLAMASWRWLEKPLIHLAGRLGRLWSARNARASRPEALL
jgi:peptidoglycan/LPS O-acetylase OafA/YrhL